MYKRIIFNELTPQDCTRFKIPPTSIPIVSSTKVIAFAFIPWDGDWSEDARDTIIDFGIASAHVNVSQTERSLTPVRENTIRIKNGDKDYPSNPTQTETLSPLEIGPRLKDYFTRSVANNPVVLLVNDESRTKNILKKYGIDTQELGWKSGLKELWRFGEIEVGFMNQSLCFFLTNISNASSISLPRPPVFV
ncbi:hypothetical protein L218DRAFT_541471 [Marasmius fiardii PR-910]|nr:hypothetical protein L218DRAFT_541471 [Marasmius fiardii PR-910]